MCPRANVDDPRNLVIVAVSVRRRAAGRDVGPLWPHGGRDQVDPIPEIGTCVDRNPRLAAPAERACVLTTAGGES